MARAQVTLVCDTCGKEFTMTAFCRNRTDANKWEDWASGYYTTCPECYVKAKRQKAVQEAVESGLPALDGTEKQIEFATAIRDNFKKKADAWSHIQANGEAAQAVKSIMQNTRASWWIHHRRPCTSELPFNRIVLEEMAKAEPIIFDLPELKGTEKQIKWASDLREVYARTASYIIRKQKSTIQDIKDDKNREKRETRLEEVKGAFVKMFSVQESTTWIDNRNLSTEDIVMKYL